MLGSKTNDLIQESWSLTLPAKTQSGKVTAEHQLICMSLTPTRVTHSPDLA
jgi:hypothetical protein